MRTKIVSSSVFASCHRIATRIAVASCLFAAAGALAAEPPILKSGLWELSRNTDRQPDVKRLTTMCLDESVQAEMREFGLGVAKELCSKSDRRVDGDRLIIDAVCKLGSTSMTSHSVMTFSGNTAYHTDTRVTYDPPFMNMTEGTSSVDGKWVGACLPGQQPGDIKLESGQTINIKSMIRK